MKDYLEIEEVKEMFRCISRQMISSEKQLTEIDNIIGDGDHGIGMAIGFRAVDEALDNMNSDTINEFFKEIGMTLLDAMGGASGVIFGTMFISGYGAAPMTNQLDLDTLSSMMKKSLENIKLRGKAKVGDKTMIDSYEPAVLALEQCSRNKKSLSEGVTNAWIAAKNGVEASKLYSAKKGRAESYGNLSIGTPDPGAVSVSIIFEAMNRYITDEWRK
ncbi:dihydroxyacetone kinase subunit DhaL [uncultured Robinsoniella sp.]|uniref:dihydroxyacetone kinase subunit DhaL n=1 Tax=uncultured Robinsoniella sp. TaxID=904190 RepID=UPI00374F0806